MVLLHAFPLHAGMWREVADDLATGHLVITVDQRGFGDSADIVLPTAASLDVCADDLAGVLDELGEPGAVLVGVSMGGYVAMAFARRHASRLRGLVLADTKVTADTLDAAAKRLEIAEQVLAEGDARGFTASMLPKLLGETTRAEKPDVVKETAAILAEASSEAVAWAQRAMAARPGSETVLAGLRGLAVRGAEDTLMSAEDADGVVRALGGAPAVVIPGAGHLPPLERPREFAEAVRRLTRAV
ncbi:alpha/beta fold hydrolase [Phytomonospora endophytica]|uniref:Pimeloyl-ACP methyl ester carboxylesterase n=1 Tax=Phytomonospora endophytica TaxID=714109 RepID=A0A841F927_9ACTN|nr:alpha/beta hydrolase [Phytomonospora endophytica]MBB6032254.1 pimeloyl-ACP methyl ester carboxylesterase [Phytomonospora endophytica]